MVGRGAVALEKAHAAAGIGGSRGDRGFEIGPANMVRAGAGDEQTAVVEHAQGAQVELLVAAQRAFDGTFGLGERRRVENDGVEALASARPVAQNLKGV